MLNYFSEVAFLIVTFRYCKKRPHNFEKISHLLLKLIINLKTVWEIFFKFLLPSQNIWTLWTCFFTRFIWKIHTCSFRKYFTPLQIVFLFFIWSWGNSLGWLFLCHCWHFMQKEWLNQGRRKQSKYEWAITVDMKLVIVSYVN